MVATIWACYGFRYSTFHEPLTGNERLYSGWDRMMADKPVRLAGPSSLPRLPPAAGSLPLRYGLCLLPGP